MSRPQAVIFDIGNVLIGWHAEDFYDRRIGAAQRQALFAEVPIHAANIEVDRGAPMRQTMAALAAQHPRWHDEIMWWHDHWIDMVGPVIEGSVATLRALKSAGIPVFALTNFGDETFEIARASYPFLNDFDHAFVSARMGLIKPDPAIYAAVEQVTGIRPQDMLFTDDKAENTEAAATRGWKVHLFTGWRPWAERLVAEGLVTGKEAGL